ncbi:MAG: putative amidohydrolase YtcJ [Myxococcota bacterium]|jgi:predicted amidohydrolase YtcJ
MLLPLLLACTHRPTAPPTPAPIEVVTAGFVDAHGHPAGLGRSLTQLQLRDLPSLQATLAAVSTASETGEGWLLGRGWDQNDWPDHDGFPTAAQLDASVSERPVALRRVDGHATWLNTAGLAAAGITAETPDPEGGRIIRGPDGAPSGVLVDAAAGLIPAQPEPSLTERRRQLILGLDAIAAVGLTGVHDMGVGDAGLAAYEALDAEGVLKVRIFAYLSPDAAAVERLVANGPWCGTRLCVVGVKAYADGALGSRGALLGEAYTDEPSHSGLQIMPTTELESLAIRLLGARAQLAVHAIGDEGVHQVLDAFAAARAAVPEAAGVPLRVEHFQVARPEDVARLVPLNVVASMQPTHATSDMPWAADRLGEARIGWAYAWRDVLDAGAILAFGSDFPVEEVSPAFGFWAATTRTDRDGQPEGGWMPEQRLTFEEATHGFTGATWDALGRSAPEGDATAWVVEEDGWRRPVRTVVGGEVIWQAAD